MVLIRFISRDEAVCEVTVDWGIVRWPHRGSGMVLTSPEEW